MTNTKNPKEYFIYLKEHLGMLRDGDQTNS